jgi:hypothetical protein
MPKPHEMQIALSYLMASWRRVALMLLCYPVRDLPQSFNREHRWFDDRERGVNWPAIVREACSDGSVIAIRQANDEVGIRPTSNTNELHALAMQWVVRMSHRHPFHRWFAKGGSVL